MRMRRLAQQIALGVAAVAAVPACVANEAMPVNSGYGYGPGMGAPLSVAEPAPYAVASMPPEPLYEQMTQSPGDGYVWIDGYWHWNGYEWVWVAGRWEREQDGYLYVQPNYD